MEKVVAKALPQTQIIRQQQVDHREADVVTLQKNNIKKTIIKKWVKTKA